MKFRFECTKNDDGYGAIEFPLNSFTVHDFEMSDDVQWDYIMAEFAKFLDMVGYVGVYEAHVEGRTALEKKIDEWMEHKNANTSNPGLSD